MNFLPFTLVDPGPADINAGFGAGAGAGALPGASCAAAEAADWVMFPDVGDFAVRYVHGYGKVANVEARMVFLEDRAGILHWKIFRGISVRPLGAKAGAGSNWEVAGPTVTLFCPFWVKHKMGQVERCSSFPSRTCGQPARTRGASCAPRTSWASCKNCVGCHLVKWEVSIQGHVRLLAWRKRRHSLQGWKLFG